MNPVIPSLITLVTGSLLTFLFSRRKTRAEIRKIEVETNNTEIDGFKAIVNMWKEANADLQQQVKLLREEVQQLRHEIHALRTENEILKSGYPELPQSERTI